MIFLLPLSVLSFRCVDWPLILKIATFSQKFAQLYLHASKVSDARFLFIRARTIFDRIKGENSIESAAVHARSCIAIVIFVSFTHSIVH
jgi:hypothetical protein